MSLTLSNDLKKSFQDVFKNGSGAITKTWVEGFQLDVEIFDFPVTSQGQTSALPTGFQLPPELNVIPMPEPNQYVPRTEWYVDLGEGFEIASLDILRIEDGFGGGLSPSWNFGDPFLEEDDRLWTVSFDDLGPQVIFYVDPIEGEYLNNTGGTLRILFYKNIPIGETYFERFVSVSNPFQTDDETVAMGSTNATTGLNISDSVTFQITDIAPIFFERVYMSTPSTLQYIIELATPIEKSFGTGTFSLTQARINFKGDGE